MPGDVVEVAHPDQVVADVAGGQRGHVTHVQLDEAGVARGARAYRVKTGRLHSKHRGVYTVGHTAEPRFGDEEAAILAAGDDAFIAHYSAGTVWGFLPPRPNRPVHVTVPSPRAHRPGIRLHRTRRIDPRDVTRRHDLPVTTPARTLLDIAESEDQHTLERAYNEALAQGLVRPQQIAELLDRSPGRRGRKRLRALLEPRDGFTRNKAERELRKAVRGAGLPSAEYNVMVHGFELDAYWRDYGLNVEIDGYYAHATPRKFDSDRRRDAELQAVHGITVLRFAWTTLRDEPAKVAARIAAQLARSTP